MNLKETLYTKHVKKISSIADIIRIHKEVPIGVPLFYSGNADDSIIVSVSNGKVEWASHDEYVSVSWVDVNRVVRIFETKPDGVYLYDANTEQIIYQLYTDVWKVTESFKFLPDVSNVVRTDLGEIYCSFANNQFLLIKNFELAMVLFLRCRLGRYLENTGYSRRDAVETIIKAELEIWNLTDRLPENFAEKLSEHFGFIVPISEKERVSYSAEQINRFADAILPILSVEEAEKKEKKNSKRIVKKKGKAERDTILELYENNFSYIPVSVLKEHGLEIFGHIIGYGDHNNIPDEIPVTLPKGLYANNLIKDVVIRDDKIVIRTTNRSLKINKIRHNWGLKVFPANKFVIEKV